MAPVDVTAIQPRDVVTISAVVALTHVHRVSPCVVVMLGGQHVDVPLTDLVGHKPTPPAIRPTQAGQRVRFYSIANDRKDNEGEVLFIHGEVALVHCDDARRHPYSLPNLTDCEVIA